jgi:tetratricopeptide (TPR) repeat protein
VRKLAFLVLAACLSVTAAAAQEPTKLEADAKKAFDTGKFKEAGDKYARAAESADVPDDRKADVHLQSAWSYYIAGSSKAAREQLKSALTLRPDLKVIPDFYSPDFANLASAVRAEVAGANVPPVDVEELKRSARAKLEDGKVEEALYDLKRAETSNDPEVFRIQAEAADRLGRSADADAARRKAAELERRAVSSAPINGSVPALPAAPEGPPPVAGLVDQAQKALAAGDFRAAASFARQASETDPKNAEAHRLLADAALAAGQDAEAEREYTAAIVLDNSNAKAQFGLAALSERQKKWNTAASLYRRALDLDPRDLAAARGLGRSMAELGDASAARIAFGRAIEIDSGSAAAHNDFGVFLYRSATTRARPTSSSRPCGWSPAAPCTTRTWAGPIARRGCSRSPSASSPRRPAWRPTTPRSGSRSPACRLEQKNVDGAAAAYGTALKLDPLREDAAAGLGALLADAGRLPDAEAALTGAIENNAKSPVLWNNLGVVRVREGRYEQAIEAFHKAIALDGGFEPAKTNLARATELATLERAAS